MSSKPFLKIGLYIQTNELCNKENFDKATEIIRKSDIDIIVFPEVAHFPFEEKFQNSDVYEVEDLKDLFENTIRLSEYFGKAVVICNYDKYGTIMSIFANAFASEEETLVMDYVKHTMTSFSPFELDDYSECIDDGFPIIDFKGYRIGLTICYDCNHSMFSRKYGQQGVDIILNSTGGNVIYDKWFKYNKVRSIENSCYSFVTMGGDGTAKPFNSYVFGFNPKGKALTPVLLNGKDNDKHGVPGGIYVYDIATDDGKDEEDSSIYQAETLNKKVDIFLSKNDIDKLVIGGEKIDENLVCANYNDSNIIFCVVDSEDIYKPEKVLKLLYNSKLKPLKNKRYIIINRWESVDMDEYRKKLSIVLKVRAMENYCAVMLCSDNLTKCFQCGFNRTAQVVQPTGMDFGIDLTRTGGPEVIWKNKEGMKAIWRDNVEKLIETM